MVESTDEVEVDLERDCMVTKTGPKRMTKYW